MSLAAGRAVAIIPVRVGSQRLPGKALLAESGKPLFLHTWDRARAARSFDVAYIATDSAEVTTAARRAGAPCLATTAAPRTGSERCAEALADLDDDVRFVVDVQGDWPEIEPSDLDRLVACLRTGTAPIATLAVPLADAAKIADPNVVKVVRARDGDAMYFSRAAIPFARGSHDVARLRHIGVYAFERTTLARIPDLPSSGLDEIESLEQLRFLDNGLRIRVLDATGDPWGIETRDDYDDFLRRIASHAP